MSAPTKRVPREPTPEMVAAGGWVQAIDHVAIWRAMYDAAPDADAGLVAELERELAACKGREEGKQIIIEQLKREHRAMGETLTKYARRIERAIHWLNEGNTFAARTALSILRGDSDD